MLVAVMTMPTQVLPPAGRRAVVITHQSGVPAGERVMEKPMTRGRPEDLSMDRINEMFAEAEPSLPELVRMSADYAEEIEMGHEYRSYVLAEMREGRARMLGL